MKSTLRGDRATSAVPGSLAARFGAWARESLAARGFAVGAGLVVLAVIGRSALAGSAGAGNSSIVAAAASASAAPAPVGIQAAAATALVDAGDVATVAPTVAPTVAIEELPATPATAVAAKARATPEDPVDLNKATADDLRRLPGVGAKRAEAVISLRARLPGGRFHQIEDLLKVKGVGRTMLKRLEPLVRITR